MSTPTKNVLAVYYSQSGQLERVVRSVLAPLEADAEIRVVYEALRPVEPYPFPWPLWQFFDVFPECVYLDPPRLHPCQFDPGENFDLIVLGHQPWFLSPSLPMTGFMQSPQAAQVLRGKPVVTVMACRNMWLMAQHHMHTMIQEVGGCLIDNLVLVDQGHPAATFVTTPRWLLTGKQGRFLRVFPPAGVAEGDIAAASRFGTALQHGLQDGRIAAHKSVLRGLGAVRVNPYNIAAERLGHRSFRIWGRIIRVVGKPGQRRRLPLLLAYAAFLSVAIVTVLPLSIAVRRLLLLSPAYRERLRAQVETYEQPSGP
jgi:hypothetical protein